LARASAPTAVLLTDEGLNGLSAHVVHDGAEPFAGALRARVFAIDGSCLAAVEEPVSIPPRGAVVRSVDAMLGGFRDLTYAYRFGPLGHDVVAVELLDGSHVVSTAHHLAGGHARARQADIGLRAVGRLQDDDSLMVCVETDLFAQFVALDVDGFTFDAGWFHLSPGEHRVVRGRATQPSVERRVTGEVRALNLVGGRRIDFNELKR